MINQKLKILRLKGKIEFEPPTEMIKTVHTNDGIYERGVQSPYTNDQL